MKRDYEKERAEFVLNAAGKKVLLHSCCAPCSTTCLERLVSHFDVSVYYYNPNMATLAEFKKRADEQVRLLSELYGGGVRCVTEEYNPEDFRSAVAGLENQPEGGARCVKCFELRLGRTAEYAASHGFYAFTTTLTLSPHKNARLLNEIGEKCAEKYAIKWLPCDFKKQNGFLRSCELSEKYGLYRQDYCGCAFSLREARARKAEADKKKG